MARHQQRIINYRALLYTLAAGQRSLLRGITLSLPHLPDSLAAGSNGFFFFYFSPIWLDGVVFCCSFVCLRYETLAIAQQCLFPIQTPLVTWPFYLFPDRNKQTHTRWGACGCAGIRASSHGSQISREPLWRYYPNGGCVEWALA